MIKYKKINQDLDALEVIFFGRSTVVERRGVAVVACHGMFPDKSIQPPYYSKHYNAVSGRNVRPLSRVPRVILLRKYRHGNISSTFSIFGNVALSRIIYQYSLDLLLNAIFRIVKRAVACLYVQTQ